MRHIYPALIERFQELVEREMLACGLNSDDDRDKQIHYQARIASLRGREH
jgi:hypothetical protein